MTLKELKERVDFYYQNERNHDLMVGIPNNKGGMGPTPVTGVKGVGQGFDWDRSTFFIWPETDMKEITPKL